MDLVTRSIGIGNHQPRSYDVECGINVHGIRVLETESVDIVVLSKMTLHPLNTKIVGHLGSGMYNVALPLSLQAIHVCCKCIYMEIYAHK